MRPVIPLVILALSLLACAQAESADCAPCHSKIVDTYQRTGMARSFYRPTARDFPQTSTYYHKPSDSYFTTLQRDGKYYQRRYQLAPDGTQTNVMEKRVDYVMGSGSRALAYLNRTSRGTLVELPLAWYTEKGGYWAMNPGYDRPVHDGFRRTITYDCMFCHNNYPEIPRGNEQTLSEPIYTGALPEGMDCARCHGSGAKHIQLAKTAGTKTEAIRDAIVNPARLTPERQMEVCMQCHLETTSFPLPNALQRYERGPFSYNPGEPLSNFLLFFDHAPDKGRGDKFELASAAYRLRRSACFLKSAGKLTCTTCHNPHEQTTRDITATCRQCHATGEHMQAQNCTGCHMPARRTEDVVHAVVTDHYIQRRPPARDLLAGMPERHEAEGDYRGKVVAVLPQRHSRSLSRHRPGHPAKQPHRRHSSTHRRDRPPTAPTRRILLPISRSSAQ